MPPQKFEPSTSRKEGTVLPLVYYIHQLSLPSTLGCKTQPQNGRDLEQKKKKKIAVRNMSSKKYSIFVEYLPIFT